jgi:hypothetical protein
LHGEPAPTDGTVTVLSSFCCTPNTVSQLLTKRSCEVPRHWQRQRGVGWVARSLPPASLLRRVVRSHFASRFGRICTNTTTCKTCKRQKMPDFTAIVTPISNITERTLHQPVLPCIARYYSYSSTTTRKLHHGREFHSRCLVLSPKKTFEFFFPSYFSIQCSTAPRCQKALTGTRTRATGHGC